MKTKTTKKHLEVLRSLAAHYPEWVKPFMLGAWDASHHSGTLRTLIKRGLVDKKVAGGFLLRTHYSYRLTADGCDFVTTRIRKAA